PKRISVGRSGELYGLAGDVSPAAHFRRGAHRPFAGGQCAPLVLLPWLPPADVAPVDAGDRLLPLAAWLPFSTRCNSCLLSCSAIWSLADACLPPLLADWDDLSIDPEDVVAPLCGLMLAPLRALLVSAGAELFAPVAVVPDWASAAAGAFDFLAEPVDMSAEGAFVEPLCRASVPAGIDVLAPVAAVPDWAAAGCLVLSLPVCAMAGKPAVRSAARATPLSRCFIMGSFSMGHEN